VNLTGFLKFYGIEFGLTGSTNVNARWSVLSTTTALVVFDRCYFNIPATGSSGGRLIVGASANNNVQRALVANDCDFNLENPTVCFIVDAGGYLSVRNGKLIGMSSSSGASVFSMAPGADRSSRVDCSGFDASVLASTQYLAHVTNFADSLAVFKRIKLPASFAGFTTTFEFQHAYAPPFQVHSYGNADQYYKFYECGIEGYIEESTALYRDDGATYDGTNGFSAKLVSSDQVIEASGAVLRFKLSEITLDLTAQKTLTVHMCQDAGTVLQNDEFWLVVEHSDATDLALGTLQDTRLELLGSATDLTASTKTWTGDSGGADHRQCSLTISAITGADNAQVTVWACIAKPSTTLYVCPKVDVS
jgi:hypothetical protein